MKPRLALLCLVFLRNVGGAVAAEPAASSTASPPPPEAFPLETYTTVGGMFAANSKLDQLGWSDAEFEAFVSGLREGFRGQARAPDARAQALHAEIGRRVDAAMRRDAKAAEEYFRDPAQLESYMKQVCKVLHMERTDSGLAYTLANRMGGPRPQPGDRVVLTYAVKAADLQADVPQLTAREQTLRVNDLLPGLKEGVQMMTAGTRAVLVLPPELSFGMGAWPEGTQRGTPLFFNVVLERIMPGS